MRKVIAFCMVIAGFIGADIVSASAEWAIAVGQGRNGHYGYGTAYNQSTMRDARNVAMENCRDNSSNCKLIDSGSGNCVGLAFGTEDSAYGWAYGDSEREAGRNALRKCLQYTNGSECEVRNSFCDN